MLENKTCVGPMTTAVWHTLATGLTPALGRTNVTLVESTTVPAMWLIASLKVVFLIRERGGDAWEWKHRAPNAKNNTPTVGAVAWWPKDHPNYPLGHVAVVEAVHGDGSIDVSWDSYQPAISVRQRLSGGDLPHLYLHIDDAAIARSSGSSQPSGQNPVGHVDDISGGGGFITVRGWAADRDEPSKSIPVHVYIGGQAGIPGTESHAIGAHHPRGDINNIGFPGNHGFEEQILTGKRGNQEVCLYAINTGPGNNVLLSCHHVSIGHNIPFGAIDSVEGGEGTVSIDGWTLDRDDTSNSIHFHVYIGGKAGNPNAEGFNLKADKPRPDLNRLGVQGNHGIYHTIKTSKRGVQEVCIYGINIGEGENTELKCTTVNIQEPKSNPSPGGLAPDDSSPAPDKDTKSSSAGSIAAIVVVIITVLGGLAAAFQHFMQRR